MTSKGRYPGDTEGKWRLRLFKAWVGASFLVASYVGVVGPFTSYFSTGRSLVALAVPAIMIFMLATGLGWLVLIVTSKQRVSNRQSQ